MLETGSGVTAAENAVARSEDLAAKITVVTSHVFKTALEGVKGVLGALKEVLAENEK